MTAITTTYNRHVPVKTVLSTLEQYEFYQLPGEESVYRLMTKDRNGVYTVMDMEDLKLYSLQKSTEVELVDIDNIFIRMDFANAEL